MASRCTILGNVAILGSSAGFPPTATGIRCDDGACANILNNAQISGRGGQITAGVILGRTGTFVEGNLIQAGCALASGIGLQALDSFARIQNNRIEGTAATGCAPSTPTSTAVLLSLGAGLNEVDLHSNDLIGRIGAATCTSRGLAFDLAGAPPGGGRGLIRNNIVSAGDCNADVAVAELNAGADPRVLQNNDLWSAVLPTVLYRDEAASDLTTIAAVNALGDATVSGNISADPLYTGANKLPANSPCRDAGIATAAPPFDFEGDSRPEGPACDIGRDEFTP